jgi:adenylate cyclase
MGQEIERRFLLAGTIPIPENFEKFKIHQAYILVDKGKQVRIRLTKNKAVIGIKFTTSIVRAEFEYEVPLKDGKEIYKHCKWSLEKKRLSFSVGKEHYDVDDYPNGLVVVEVEFKSLKDMKKWKKPSWLGLEITGVRKYSNITLSKKNLKFKRGNKS